MSRPFKSPDRRLKNEVKTHRLKERKSDKPKQQRERERGDLVRNKISFSIE